QAAGLEVKGVGEAGENRCGVADHYHSLAGMRGDDDVHHRSHARYGRLGRLLKFQRAVRVDDQRHLDEALVDVDVVAEHPRGFQRSHVWTRIDGRRISMLDSLRQSFRLLAAESAERWVLGIRHVAVAVAMADEPGLGHAFDADQEGLLEGEHRPCDVVGCGGHGIRFDHMLRLAGIAVALFVLTACGQQTANVVPSPSPVIAQGTWTQNLKLTGDLVGQIIAIVPDQGTQQTFCSGTKVRNGERWSDTFYATVDESGNEWQISIVIANFRGPGTYGNKDVKIALQAPDNSKAWLNMTADPNTNQAA